MLAVQSHGRSVCAVCSILPAHSGVNFAVDFCPRASAVTVVQGNIRCDCVPDIVPMVSWLTQVQYTRQALAYLNNEPAVERYAWFTSRGYGVSECCQALKAGQMLSQAAASVVGCHLFCPDSDVRQGSLSRNNVLSAAG
jgi:Glycosyl hydrolase catalytic core